MKGVDEVSTLSVVWLMIVGYTDLKWSRFFISNETEAYVIVVSNSQAKIHLQS